MQAINTQVAGILAPQPDASTSAAAPTRAPTDLLGTTWTGSGPLGPADIASISDRRVRVDGDTSLYAQSRQWVRNQPGGAFTMSTEETPMTLPPLPAHPSQEQQPAFNVSASMDTSAHSDPSSLEAHMPRWKMIRTQMQQRAIERRKPYEQRLGAIIGNTSAPTPQQ